MNQEQFWIGISYLLIRNIVSPNNECNHFLELSNQVHLKPLGYEYSEDKFCSINQYKFCLCEMPFSRGRSKKRETIFHYRKIIDFHKYDGKPFNTIKTLWGENLVDFHHRILFVNLSTIELFDASLWYKANGGIAEGYYQHFMAFFICNGILFENFLLDNREGTFTNQVVLPAIEKVKTYFGVKPLIVPISPQDEATDIYWYCYPKWVEKEIAERAGKNDYKSAPL